MKENTLSMTEASDLVELIELGFNNAEIHDYLPSISIGVIAAYRAHVTRGTYSGGRSHASHSKSLSNRQKMILDAVDKMRKGTALFTEGQLEFAHLTGEKKGHGNKTTTAGGKDVTKDVEKLAPKKVKKTVANRVGRVKSDKKPSPELLAKLMEDIPKLVKADPLTTKLKLKDKLKTSFYPIQHALKALIAGKVLRYEMKINPRTNMSYKYLALA